MKTFYQAFWLSTLFITLYGLYSHRMQNALYNDVNYTFVQIEFLEDE